MARKLAKNVFVGETFYAAGSTPPKEDADQITNPAAWGDDVAGSDGGEDEGNALPSTVPGLEAEVEKRNADREDGDRIEVTGTGKDGKVLKKDLVAALEADDAARAASE